MYDTHRKINYFCDKECDLELSRLVNLHIGMEIPAIGGFNYREKGGGLTVLSYIACSGNFEAILYNKGYEYLVIRSKRHGIPMRIFNPHIESIPDPIEVIVYETNRPDLGPFDKTRNTYDDLKSGNPSIEVEGVGVIEKIDEDTFSYEIYPNKKVDCQMILDMQRGLLSSQVSQKEHPEGEYL